ncbi:two pore channel protein 2 isoform X3 [Poecilia reticulata]|uniref:two pore channel protein 2 isoform X3 n=1 Tax=Poecilia reticulata TaxID=8081 RepID=UPI0004A3D014|nr:PREDICTED: two pore calcium channel protein 2 isoform X3 [Poecilia reticulata]
METDRLLTGAEDPHSGDYGSGPARSGGDSRGSRRMSYSTAGDCCRSDGDDEDLYIQQAVVFIEDAIHYRSINHRVDAGSLRLYRWYYSRIYQWILGTIIAVVLLLAFVERPSSLSISSDPRHQSSRWEPPCGAPESVEMLCLIIFCLDLAVKSYLIGWEEFRKSKWLISYTVVICVSVLDWVLSVSMECDEKLRVRRLVRPFFLLQNSPLMKKTLKCIKRTLPEIASVILLLSLHLCLFTMIGMLLFAKNAASQQFAEQGYMDRQQFRKIFDELDKDCINEHPPLPQYTSATLQKLQVVFSHYYLTVLGNLVALANVLCICTILVLNSEKSTEERDNYILEVINLCFILFYLSEMSIKIFAFGWRGYLSYRSNIFDGFLTVLLLILQIAIFITYRLPYSQEPSSRGVMSLWEMVRLVNMLIVFRFLRIIPDIKLMTLVASTLLDLVKNLRAFAGILVVVYYVFAVFGIWLFEGAIKPPPQMSVFSMDNTTSNFSMACGTYEQLGYWPNNFDDFAAAVILLYDVMIVNNWQAFMEAYSRYTSEWSKVYFVCWWLTSSVMWVNLFVALILENFIYKWDRSHSCSVTDVEKIRYETSVQFMFKEQIQEPTEEELVCQLHQHPHLHLEWRHEHQNIRSSLH